MAVLYVVEMLASTTANVLGDVLSALSAASL